MPLRLRITESNQSDLQAICDVPVEHLRASYDALVASEPEIQTLKDIFRVFERTLSNRDTAKILVRQLFALSSLGRNHQLSGDEVFGALNTAVLKHVWPEEGLLKKWAAVSEVIKEFLGNEILNCTVKSVDLASDYTNKLDTARILTDLRPVFDDDRDTINSLILTNVLRIRYWNDAGEASISISVDRNDIKMLLRSCEQALRKMDIGKALAEKSGVRSIDPAEDLDDAD